MIVTNDEILNKLSKQFEELQSNLECYLNPPEELSNDLIMSSKMVYDQMKSDETCDSKIEAAPKQLLTRGFEDEQIWQQLNLQNVSVIRASKKIFHNVAADDIALKDDLAQNDINGEDVGDEDFEGENDQIMNEEEEEDEEEDEIDYSDDEDDIEEDEREEINKSQKMYKKSVVDDKFFKLRQLEEFLDQQDKLEEYRRDKEDGPNQGDDEEDDNDEEDFDMFAAEDSGSDFGDDENLMYKDFFDPPAQGISDTKELKKEKEKKKKVTFENDNGGGTDDLPLKAQESSTEEEDDEGVDAEDTNKTDTAFERKQAEMKQKISKLEDVNISAKPWQQLGETSSKARPMNSLLEEHVTFDHTSVGTPVITEETTTSIEDIIKRRIRDQAWDDVEKKVKPTTQPHEYKRAPELNMEKSKISLAEVYEKEYLKEMEDDKEEKENKEHTVIQNLMDKLFVKLDALSNFYFTPKPPKPDIKIITNTPSLQMEEVTPITMTSASQMAPEEIFEKKKGERVGEGEKSTEDRKRERRQKKIKKKFASKEKEKKESLKAKSTGKSSKKKAVEQLKKGMRNTLVSEQNKNGGEVAGGKSFTSSTNFFNKLQDEVTKKISDHKAKSGPTKAKKQKTQHLKL